MPTCAKCKKQKRPDEFNKKTDRLSGHQPYCKACNKKESAKSNTSRRETLEGAKTLLVEARDKLDKAWDKLKDFTV